MRLMKTVILTLAPALLVLSSAARAAAGDVHVDVSTYCGGNYCVEVTTTYIENPDGTLKIFETKQRIYSRYPVEK